MIGKYVYAIHGRAVRCESCGLSAWPNHEDGENAPRVSALVDADDHPLFTRGDNPPMENFEATGRCPNGHQVTFRCPDDFETFTRAALPPKEFYLLRKV